MSEVFKLSSQHHFEYSFKYLSVEDALSTHCTVVDHHTVDAIFWGKLWLITFYFVQVVLFVYVQLICQE